MATNKAAEKGTGLSILFVVLALGGALTMALGAENHALAATGFAVAILGGSLAIAARHVYP